MEIELFIVVLGVFPHGFICILHVWLGVLGAVYISHDKF